MANGHRLSAPWAAFVLAIIINLVIAGIAWGAMVTRVGSLEGRLDRSDDRRQAETAQLLDRMRDLELEVAGLRRELVGSVALRDREGQAGGETGVRFPVEIGVDRVDAFLQVGLTVAAITRGPESGLSRVYDELAGRGGLDRDDGLGADVEHQRVPVQDVDKSGLVYAGFIGQEHERTGALGSSWATDDRYVDLMRGGHAVNDYLAFALEYVVNRDVAVFASHEVAEPDDLAGAQFHTHRNTILV